MKKLVLSISFYTICICLAFGQFHKVDLLGTWELDREESDLKSDLTISISNNPKTKKLEKIEIILKFNDNNILDFKQGSKVYRAEYKLTDDNLYLGTSLYKILKLNSDSLIMIEDAQLFPKTFYYVKSDTVFKTIKEYEDYEERYPNGQLKIKGTYHNGIEDGLWEEWYENGQKKIERNFKDGIPVGKWKKWDETGKSIKN